MTICIDRFASELYPRFECGIMNEHREIMSKGDKQLLKQNVHCF